MLYRNKKRKKRNNRKYQFEDDKSSLELEYERNSLELEHEKRISELEDEKRTLENIFSSITEEESKKRHNESQKLDKPKGYPERNIQIQYKGKSVWLWNKGHLIASSFADKEHLRTNYSGNLNSKDNLIPQTSYLNYLAYSAKGDERQNKECMRYYEEMVRNKYAYDCVYSVEPVYSNKESIPRQVKITINEKEYIVENKFPGLEINYDTGEVIIKDEFDVTVKDEFKDSLPILQNPEQETSSENLADNPPVYYLASAEYKISKDKKIFWYSRERLENDSTGAIKSCSKKEALDKGFRGHKQGL